MSLANVRVVLVHPREPGNVGAAARVVANMELGGLVLVQPVPRRRYRTAAGWTPGDADPPLPGEPITGHPLARAFAAGAGRVLDEATLVLTLPEAVGASALVVGYTVRPRSRTAPPHTPRELAADVILAARSGPVSLVFGPEDRGLTNRELDCCNRLVRIPTGLAYPAMNLAASVAVAAYELAASGAAAEPDRKGARTGALPASAAQVELLLERSADYLARVPLVDGKPEKGLAVLRALLARAHPTRKELGVLLGALSRLSARS